MVKFYVYFAVIVSGASVLAIELLGTRVIAPFYGASLYLWSALISVTLAALATGYAIGGRWADRGPRLGRFALVIGLAGLWIAVVPWIRFPVLAAAESLGLRAAVLITATVLFFPPLTLLGVVSPYAIRLMASSLSVVGTTAGNLYAVSTVASVAAALATGFVLIPAVGVYRLIFWIGFALISTALFGLVVGRRRAAAVLPLLLAIVAVLLYGRTPALTADPESGLVAVSQSAYGEIRVVDWDGSRCMLIDGATHTVVDPETLESRFGYVNALDIPKAFFSGPEEMLLVGLGGGSVVKNYAQEGWRVEAVEIDPVVTRMAREHFDLRPGEAAVHNMDGRQFLIAYDGTFDVIILDAFGSSSIPFHLVTAEAIGLARSRLSPGGILAMNVEAVGWDDILVRSLAATAWRVFEHVVVLPIVEPPDQVGNLIILASDRELELPFELPLPEGRFTAEYDRAHAWDNRFAADTAGVPVLTDDLNPIDVWAERINLEARRNLHDYFDTEGLIW